MMTKEHDSNRDELLDHVADGIREFDNALPRWWLYGFYFTIAFAVVYMVNYHVLTTPVFGKAGMAAEYRAELDAAKITAPTRLPGGSANALLVALTDEPSLTKGRTIFENPDNVCSSCHRPDLGGMVGPNLTDDYWLHGCAVRDVVTSIKTGYPLKGMMPFGTGKPLTDEQLLQLASYVMSKRGSSPAGPKPIDPERDVICR
jgi:cytochrome c oxidase cbb3-type subunit III